MPRSFAVRRRFVTDLMQAGGFCFNEAAAAGGASPGLHEAPRKGQWGRSKEQERRSMMAK